MTEFTKDSLKVKIATTAEKMGAIAAEDIYLKITELLKEKEEINIIFAAAPSQNTTLDALVTKDIDWSRINAFHMDEYIGLTKPEAAFCKYLEGRIFGKVNFRSVNYINALEKDVEKECCRYGSLLKKYPADIVILGIGENGHIAFNDPPVADFNDKVLVKPVELDMKCRTQQVHDGCFDSIDRVPTHALSLTVPALTRAKYMFCVVPYKTKAEAVKEMLTTDKIDEHCPATALRLHSGATLYCDSESTSLLVRKIKSNNIITQRDFKKGCVYIQGGVITAVTDKDLPCDIEEDYEDLYVSPGFVDLHVHGGNGYDYMETDAKGADLASAFHMKHGTTSILPTLAADSFEGMKKALSALSECRAENFCGVHIEGPYFAKSMSGAQNPEFITPPVKKEYEYLLDKFPGLIKRWSYAPEKDKDFEFTKTLAQRGVIPSAGHTEATYTQMKQAAENGCSLITHLYSCTSTVTRKNGFRRGGVVEFALENDDIFAELITDGAHLPPELINLVCKVKGREKVMLVTDAMKVSGTDVKEGTLNGVDFIVEDGVCKKTDRSAFAGSIATADRLVRTCKNAGIPLADCVCMASSTPAKLLKLNAGVIKEGFDADIVVFDENINIKAVYKKGERP